MPGAKKTPAKKTAKVTAPIPPVEEASSSTPVVEEVPEPVKMTAAKAPKKSSSKPVEEVPTQEIVVGEPTETTPEPVVEVQSPKKPATPAKVSSAAKKVASPAPAPAKVTTPAKKVSSPAPAPVKVVAALPKTVTPAKKAAPKPEPEEEDEGLPVCKDDVCELDPEEDEEQEEDEENEPIYIEDRVASVPITSVMSPRNIARTSAVNRVMSPRTGDARSPRRTIDPRKAKSDSQYKDLQPNDLLYNEDDIATVTFSHYANVRAADVITFLIARERCPFVFRKDGVITREDDPDVEEVTPVQYADDLDEAFELFECIEGILAFMPSNDMDFGDDDDTVHRLGSNSDYVYIAPVLSSGDDGGAIRFVDDLVIWGAIPLETYDKMKTRPTYRQEVKRMDMLDIRDIFSQAEEGEEYNEEEGEEGEEYDEEQGEEGEEAEEYDEEVEEDEV